MSSPGNNPFWAGSSAITGTGAQVVQINPSQAIPVGATLLAIASVNTALATNSPALSDSQLNTWTADNDTRASSPGTMTFRCKVTHALATTDTISTSWTLQQYFRATAIVCIPNSDLDVAAPIVSSSGGQASMQFSATPTKDGVAAVLLTAIGSSAGQPSLDDSGYAVLGFAQNGSGPGVFAAWKRLASPAAQSLTASYVANAGAGRLYMVAPVGATQPLAITTAALPPATQGSPYDQTLEAEGGTPPYSWSAQGLPAGLSISGNKITGTPSAAGTSQVTLNVTDSS